MVFTLINKSTYGGYVSVSPFNFTLTTPVGISDNDILFTFISLYHPDFGNYDIDSVPSGWELIASNLGDNLNYYIYYKLASNEPSSYIWSFSVRCYLRATIVAYTQGSFDISGVGDITYSSDIYTVSNTICRAGSINVLQNSPLLFFGAARNPIGTVTYTKPTTPNSNWVEDDDSGDTTSHWFLTVCSMTWSEPGDTGDVDATMSTTISSGKHAFLVGLKVPVNNDTHTDIETNEPPETGPPPVSPANMWTDIMEIIRYYLRDPDGQIFTDAELLQYYNDAQFEIAVKSGPVIRVEAHYFPPEYDASYTWDWESDFGEGTQYQCLTINQADGWVICYPWEAAYWLDVEPSQDDGYRDIHPWEMCLGSAADVIRVPLHKKFHKMLYCAFDELTLDPIDEKRLAEQDAFYRSRTGEAVNYYRPDEMQNEIVIYPLPSNIWDETEVYEVLADTGGMISDESWLDLRDLGITYDVVPTDGMLVEVYEAMPDELTGWEDIPDLPPYMVKYARYGALERAYGADTDAFIPSLRDYWALRKKIGVEALKKWKRLSKVNRDYRLGGHVSRVQSRHPRLPEHYPSVT